MNNFEIYKEEVKDPYYLEDIKSGLKFFKMTQRELAFRVGCSVSHANAVLNKRNPYISMRFWWGAQQFRKMGKTLRESVLCPSCGRILIELNQNEHNTLYECGECGFVTIPHEKNDS